MQPQSFTTRLDGVDHATHRGKIVRQAADGSAALATDAAAQQPCGVIVGGGTYTTTRATVVVGGPARALVGAAGLVVGFNFVTCDAASKLKVAGGGDAVLGYVNLKGAATEDELVEVFVAPRP